MKNLFKNEKPVSSVLTILTIVSLPSFASTTEVETVEIVGQRNQAHSEPTIETEKLLSVAGIDGDPLAAVFSLPGVIYAGGDDGGEPAIRGSSPSDNAFYIDNLPTDYIFHLFGDSIFNKNLLRNVELDAAAFGSQYGNATGGVFNVQLRDPREQPIAVKVDASLLKTGVLVEGKTFDNQAFYFSYRRSLIHLFLSEGSEDEGITIFDAPISDDYQGKYQWLIGSDHKLTFNINGASDKGGFNISEEAEMGRIDPDVIGDASISSRFDSQGFQWEWFANQDDTLSIAFNHVLSEGQLKFGADQFEISEDDEFNLRVLAQSTRIDQHSFSLGLDIQTHDFSYSLDTIPYFCTEHTEDCADQKGLRIQGEDNIKAKIYGAYFNDVWQPHPDFNIEWGLRAEYDNYTEKSFIHPRASVAWHVLPEISIFSKAGSYSRFPDVNTALPLLGNPDIQPFEAEHMSAGVEWKILENWQTKMEIYQKKLSQLAKETDINGPNADLHYTNDLSGSAKGVDVGKKFE